MKKRISRSITIVTFIALLGICLPVSVAAIQPSTQMELDKANAEVQKTEAELKAAYDYADKCKETLDQAIASGDQIAISNADFEHKRALTLVKWYAERFFNAKTYLDHVNENIVYEKQKEDYTIYVLKKAEVDVAAAALTEAQVQLKTAQDKLAQTQQNINDLNVALPTHPDLQVTLNTRLAEIPLLQADITNKEAAVKVAKEAYDNKAKELHALDTIVWTYGEHEIYTYYAQPFYPIEKIW
ncbi:MAG: hypothetical protein J5518_03105 [Lachnospiraceae bacterium]|nr:hypothetical protein [Lachnospiraceae bacterium]